MDAPFDNLYRTLIYPTAKVGFRLPALKPIDHSRQFTIRNTRFRGKTGKPRVLEYPHPQKITEKSGRFKLKCTGRQEEARRHYDNSGGPWWLPEQCGKIKDEAARDSLSGGPWLKERRLYGCV